MFLSYSHYIKYLRKGGICCLLLTTTLSGVKGTCVAILLAICVYYWSSTLTLFQTFLCYYKVLTITWLYFCCSGQGKFFPRMEAEYKSLRTAMFRQRESMAEEIKSQWQKTVFDVFIIYWLCHSFNETCFRVCS